MNNQNRLLILKSKLKSQRKTALLISWPFLEILTFIQFFWIVSVWLYLELYCRSWNLFSFLLCRVFMSRGQGIWHCFVAMPRIVLGGVMDFHSNNLCYNNNNNNNNKIKVLTYFNSSTLLPLLKAHIFLN